MDAVDKIPILVSHADEGLVTEDTSVVDNDINAAECLEGSLDNLLTILNRVVVGDSLTASLADFINNNVSSTLVSALASVGTTEIVDD